MPGLLLAVPPPGRSRVRRRHEGVAYGVSGRRVWRRLPPSSLACSLVSPPLLFVFSPPFELATLSRVVRGQLRLTVAAVWRFCNHPCSFLNCTKRRRRDVPPACAPTRDPWVDITDSSWQSLRMLHEATFTCKYSSLVSKLFSSNEHRDMRPPARTPTRHTGTHYPVGVRAPHPRPHPRGQTPAGNFHDVRIRTMITKLRRCGPTPDSRLPETTGPCAANWAGATVAAHGRPSHMTRVAPSARGDIWNTSRAREGAGKWGRWPRWATPRPTRAPSGG